MRETTTGANHGILASRLAASGQWDRLLDVAREWLAQEPENVTAHGYAALSLVNLGRHRQAEIHLHKVLAVRPDDGFTHRLMSLVHFEQKRFNEADASIKQAISLQPNDPNHWYHLARMCYVQKDLASGLKWVSKARELAPNDPDILNLYALCSANGPAQAAILNEVLALDPENAFAHNNLGTYYLETAKDYPRAEECFRRALALQPSLAVARRNLFLALKQRDLIYRILVAPRDFLLSIRRAVFGGERRHPVALVVGGLVWLLLFRFVLGGLLLWCAFVWPTLKTYEFFVIGDIRKKAGEAGTGRGVLGYRRWSLKVRLAIFALLLAGFWCGVGFLFYRLAGTPGEAGAEMVTAVVTIALLALLVFLTKKAVKDFIRWFHSRRRSRRLRHLATSKHD